MVVALHNHQGEIQMTNVIFDKNATENEDVKKLVLAFLGNTGILEKEHNMDLIIFQDGANDAYYVKCSLTGKDAVNLCDLSAKLEPTSESLRANRKLFTEHTTYKRMENDAKKGREFNDVIVEYNLNYVPEKPLKVWGGQHRVKSITTATNQHQRYHGFKIYFNLSKKQRTDVALISNTNISVSNDTFDRIIEDTIYGGILRDWCKLIGFLSPTDDFPDVGSRSEKITVKKARSFVVNYYLGKSKGANLSSSEIDKNAYEPYLAGTGIKGTSEINVDKEYDEVMSKNDILKDKELIEAGKRFLALHNAQYRAVVESGGKIPNNKGFRNKAFVESVLCGWSYVAGLLQSHPERLQNHYQIPKTTSKIIDPLNAVEMSKYKHDGDKETYRGLGTRSSLTDRQRVAQLFLAKSLNPSSSIDEKLIEKAVNQVVGILSLTGGYA